VSLLLPTLPRGRITSMHWFWRGILAAAIGALLSVVVLVKAPYVFHALTSALLFSNGGKPVAALVHFLLCAILVLAMYGLLTWCLPMQRLADTETRCRKCSYILRGISEPRCPECGERI
jgi:hypothetical protein